MSVAAPRIQHTTQLFKDANGTPVTLQAMVGSKVRKEHMVGIQNFLLQEIRKNRKFITSIQDLVEAAYPSLYQGTKTKADAPFVTSSPGASNDVYGALVWEQVVTEANVWGVMEQEPWLRSGFRMLTTRPTLGSTPGQAELPANLPETNMPALLPVSTPPKIIATTFNVSALSQQLALVSEDDTLDNPMAFLREYMGREHKKLLNEELLTDSQSTNALELLSLDVIVASYSEVNGHTLTAGSCDLYGGVIDRDSASYGDAYVNWAASNRKLTLPLIDTLITQTQKYRKGGERYVFITGYDTLERWGQLIQNQQSYTQMPTEWVTTSVNGIQSVQPGIDGGIQLSAYRNFPILTSEDVPQDGLSRIYFINLETTKMKVLMPTQYFEAGLLTTGNPFGLDTLADEGLYCTMAETICYQPNANAKLRDIA